MSTKKLRIYAAIYVVLMLLMAMSLQLYVTNDRTKTLEQTLYEFMVSEITFIDSVAMFDATYSTSDYGNSALDATRFQIQNHIANYEPTASTIQMAIIQLEDDQVLETTSTVVSDVDFLDKHMEPLLISLKSGDAGVIEAEVGSKKYLIRYQAVDNIQCGLLVFADLDVYLKSSNLSLFLMFSFVAVLSVLVIGFVVVLRKRMNHLINIQEKRLELFFSLKKSGLWSINLQDETIKIPSQFMKELGYASEVKIRSMGDFYKYIDDVDSEMVKLNFHDLEFGYVKSISIVYHFIDSKGQGRRVFSEFATDSVTQDGYARNLIGITTLVDREGDAYEAEKKDTRK